jgi:hypothetical protein
MSGVVISEVQPARKSGFARFWRTLKQIFHEVVGGVFAVLALVWVQSAIRAWTRDVAHWLVFAACGMAIVLGIFAWTSFRRARQMR